MKVSNKTYDVIKLISLIAAPVIVFLSAVISIWDIPYGAQITATLAALDTLVGALTIALKKSYDKNHTLNEVDLDEVVSDALDDLVGDVTEDSSENL